MPHRQYVSKLAIDQAELAARRAYFEVGDDDLVRLAALRPFAEKCNGEIVEEFYRFLLRHPQSRRFFPDEATVARVKKLQAEYFMRLFSGKLDMDYITDRLRVGTAHERIGMPSQLYLGAYAMYLRTTRTAMEKALGDTDQMRAGFASLQKLVFFDMALAVETYTAAHADSIERHQAAIRELSTPVIQVYERVLLLPLIGAVDTARAQQIMETVLTRVAEHKAKVLILDIAGVAVVDTKVADHLLKTTAAVRLLGADTILTGISPRVAQTMVQLGVEISAMRTCSRLSDGISLALDVIGRRIVDGGAA